MKVPSSNLRAKNMAFTLYHSKQARFTLLVKEEAMLIDGGEVGGGCPLLPDDDVVPPDDEAVDAVGDSTTGADAVDL